jgi:biopolymer transport protein TolR
MPKLAPASASASGRSGRGRRVSTSLAEINVVPLVDVMLVLLIIFMVTAPMIQRGIDVKLPVASRSAPVTGERVEVTVPAAYRNEHFVFVGTDRVRADDLAERIRQKLENGKAKEVYLRGDATLQYQDLMDVFSRLKAAGVQNIGMVTKMPGER